MLKEELKKVKLYNQELIEIINITINKYEEFYNNILKINK